MNAFRQAFFGDWVQIGAGFIKQADGIGLRHPAAGIAVLIGLYAGLLFVVTAKHQHGAMV